MVPTSFASLPQAQASLQRECLKNDGVRRSRKRNRAVVPDRFTLLVTLVRCVLNLRRFSAALKFNWAAFPVVLAKASIVSCFVENQRVLRATYLGPPRSPAGTCVIRTRKRGIGQIWSASTGSSVASGATMDEEVLDWVEIPLHLPHVGRITILEASAKTQEELVNSALLEGDVDLTHEDPSAKDNNVLVGTEKMKNSNLSLLAGDPYGAVLWPAALAVSKRIIEAAFDDASLVQIESRAPLQSSSRLRSRKASVVGGVVLEVGTGTGLVAMAACAAGAAHVIATDYEAIPLRLLRQAARYLNSPLLDNVCVSSASESFTDKGSFSVPLKDALAMPAATVLDTQCFDLCDMTTRLPFPFDPQSKPGAALNCTRNCWFVAADVMYEPRTGRALAHRVVEALEYGCHVLIGDSPGRAGRPAFLKELGRLGLYPKVADFVDVVGSTVVGARHDLICAPTSPTINGDTQNPSGSLTVAIMEIDASNVNQNLISEAKRLIHDPLF
jgi:Lysine methyltransferase